MDEGPKPQPEDEVVAMRRQMEALRAQLAQARIENNHLRLEKSEDAGGWPKPAASPAAAPAPAPTPVPASAAFCPSCHRRKAPGAELAPCPDCGDRSRPEAARPSAPASVAPQPAKPAPAPKPQAAPKAEPAKPSVYERLSRAVRRLMDAVRGQGAERVIGEKLLNYVGMLMLVLGASFFLKYTFGFSGPLGKLGIGLGSGAALIVLGERLRRRPDFELFSVPLIGGGWILVYYSTFAAHWLPAARLIESPALGFALLCAAAAGMIVHSIKVRSRLLTTFAYGTAFFAFAVTHLGAQSLTVCTILALSGAFLVRELGYTELAAVNLAGFYANYFPIFRQVLAADAGHRLPQADFWYGLGVTTAVHVLYALVAPVRTETEKPEPLGDAVLSFGAIVYASLFYSQVVAYDPMRPAAALLALAAILTGLSVVRGRSHAALDSVQSLLAALVAALAIVKLPTAAGELWGFSLAASLFGMIGLWLDRPAFEKYGAAMVGLAGAVLVFDWNGVMADKWWAAAALMYLGLACYALAALRHSRGRRDDALTGLWFYFGLGAVLMSFWTCLEPAAFLLTLLTLGLALDWLAEATGAQPLLHHALIVQTGAALYSFAVDYGSNLPALGPLTPRGLGAGALAATYACLLSGRALPEGRFLGMRYADWRTAQTWLYTAATAFGVYREFGPRLRLPLWSVSALALLAAGRRRGPSAGHLRLQGYLLALGAATEGVVSYLYYPSELMPTVGWTETLIYGASALLLLWPLAWAPWSNGPEERSEELGAGYMFSILSLVLLALFVGKEADGAYVTLGWTLIGVSYILTGLLAGRQSLRQPGLTLVGLCVLKALFRDMTGLELPYRVLSYTIMGGLLVLSSYLYVQHTKKEDSDAA